MKEYPHTSQQFSVNNKIHIMKKVTLGLSARIEDQNISVTLVEVLEECTDMENSDIMKLDSNQVNNIYEDIVLFSSSDEVSEGGEPKKP